MRRPRHVALGAVLTLLLGVPAHAQITARHGEKKDDPNELGSPMVLEAPFFAADPAWWNDRWASSADFIKLRKYRCEGISVDIILVKLSPPEHDRIAARLKLTLFNPDGNHDKAVRVRLEIRNGDDIVGEAEFGPVKDEESDRVSREVGFTFPTSAMKTDPITTLKIVVTAQNI